MDDKNSGSQSKISVQNLNPFMITWLFGLVHFQFNPIAFRKAKTVCSFGPSECNGVKGCQVYFILYKFIYNHIALKMAKTPLSFSSSK